MLTDRALDFPDFPGRENANKGRILAEATCFLSVGAKQLADFHEWTLQDSPPFRIATQKRRHFGIADGPIVEVGECDPDQLRFCLKSLRNSAPQFQTDFIIDAMTHEFSPATLTASYHFWIIGPRHPI